MIAQYANNNLYGVCIDSIFRNMPILAVIVISTEANWKWISFKNRTWIPVPDENKWFRPLFKFFVALIWNVVVIIKFIKYLLIMRRILPIILAKPHIRQIKLLQGVNQYSISATKTIPTRKMLINGPSIFYFSNLPRH